MGPTTVLLALVGLVAVAEQRPAGHVDLAQDDECAAGAGTECAVSALQLRAAKRVGLQVSEAEQAQLGAGCHTMKEGELGQCMEAITWAMDVGYPAHPDWYLGLVPGKSPLIDWQIASYNTTNSKCPRPCGFTMGTPGWCKMLSTPSLWQPAAVSAPVQIKILSYNLYWWNNFKIHGGFASAALIKEKSQPQPFDVMGFQECEDAGKVLSQAGLLDQYVSFGSGHATCMAFRKDSWALINRGEAEVAEDMRTEYYGKRSAQWMRLRHLKSDVKLLFMNHHGPLSINSGGECGGQATANNLMQVMASNAQVGDVLVLVGDFNANAASLTVQSLWSQLTHVYNSRSFGGVDNIFSNVPRSDVIETLDLGQGGSDHHAIAAVLGLGDVGMRSLVAGVEPVLAVDALKLAEGSDGCLMEPETQYVFPASGWSFAMAKENIVDARHCCKACQGSAKCTMWTFTEWDDARRDSLCTIGGGPPASTIPKDGWVSGLPKSAAVSKAQAKL